MAETKRMRAEQVVGYLLEGEGLDFLRESLAWVVQQLMEVEVSELIGAARGERTRVLERGEALVRERIGRATPDALEGSWAGRRASPRRGGARRRLRARSP